MATETPRRQNDELKAHADAGPSAAERWLVCPASVTLTRGVERKSTAYTREGSAAHAAAELILLGKPVPEIITIEDEAILITEEMLEHISVYTRFVDMLRATSDFEAVECRVNLDWWFAPQPLPEPCHGTADFISYDSKQRTLTVVDFKYGQGHAVEVENNPQLMIYAMGALGLFDFEFPVKVQMVIVQPRVATPIRSHTILLNELTRWAETTLKPALTRIGAGDASESAGDHCRWCTRAGTCSELTQTAIDAARLTFSNQSSSEPSPSDYSSSELSEILNKAELISAWVTKVRTEVEERIKNGADVPGWKLVAKRGQRKWISEDAAAFEFSNLLGDVAYEPRSLLSPAQMEKQLKKIKADMKVLDRHVVKESSGLTLARSDDAREGIDCSPSSVFAPVLVGFDG